ncbi:hypothetical protein RJ639_039796 [Escallonia herrerae]|uniref:B30.2/SPRY domain-containing protein n=1 Tax=Escallonia herrerae TaxID=1293975 RepID=A0AA88WJ51_9ASTE|nr:hypothetical protein RJ639_039796 [Escallonia herrerae]
MVDADQQQQRHQQDLLIDTYFLELWRQNSRASMTLDAQRNGENEDMEDNPTELDTINSSGGFSVVFPDKLTVQYPSVNLHGHDVGVVQANKPAPVRRLVYYFEVFVKNAGAKGQIGIGFTAEGFKMSRQPGCVLLFSAMPRSLIAFLRCWSQWCSKFIGEQLLYVPCWEANSYGYHGDDGLLYRGHGKGEEFGPTFTAGDTVGGGINYASQELFFTKNGAVVGTVYKDVKGRLFPTIAVHSQNEEYVMAPPLLCLKSFDLINVISEKGARFFLVERGRGFVSEIRPWFKLAKDDALVDFEIDEDLYAAWWSFLKRCLVGRVEDVSVLAPSCTEVQRSWGDSLISGSNSRGRKWGEKDSGSKRLLQRWKPSLVCLQEVSLPLSSDLLAEVPVLSGQMLDILLKGLSQRRKASGPDGLFAVGLL